MAKWIAALVVSTAVLMAPGSCAGQDGWTGSGTSLWNRLLLPFRLLRLSVKGADDALLIPVKGAQVRQVANTWHAPRPGGRLHEGQDIFAPRGTPVLSATSGVVIGIGQRDLGGQTVAIVGGGGRTYYYAHLDRYAEGLGVGDTVTTNTVIGYVGNTGNARTASPHLHFGVFGRRGAVDPLPLLRDRDGGRGVDKRGPRPLSMGGVWTIPADFAS
jgi:murein DD-endopeptidase MepM/ murein hydrolase activator NlpD